MTTFLHDCPKCRQLQSGAVDWYHCPGSLGGSIIGRYGDEPSEYWSMAVGVIMSVSTEGSDFMRDAKRLIVENKLEWNR